MRVIALALMLAVCGVVPALAAPPSPLTLWYDRPAADWEREGLPIGNGAMGAMVMGAVAVDRLQFNEKTLWTGGPGSAGYDYGLPDHPLGRDIAHVRDELNRTGRMEPEAVAGILGHKAHGYGDYQSFGEVVVALADQPARVTGYLRELDIAHAVARVRYTVGGVHYLREYFASYPAHVIVVRYSADKPGHISLMVAFSEPNNRTVGRSVHDGRTTVSGALNDNGLKYEAALQVIAEGGERTDAGDGIAVRGADAVVMVLAAGTNYATHYPDYRGQDPHADVQARADAAAASRYARLLADHETDYRALFDRMALDIVGRVPAIPTDRALAQYTGGKTAADRALEELYFQYGRYLLIASSRPGSLPAHLQGVWNNSMTPPWNADYHVNINLQMNYWAAETANLGEVMAPFLDFVDALQEPGRHAARLYGAGDPQAWTLSLNTDPWGFTGLIDWPTAFWQPEAGAWLADQYFDHYRFTADEEFLKTRAYPVVKGAAQFWLDNLVTDPRDGKLVVSPSYSPEHGPFSAGASMSQQIVFAVLSDASEAAHHLHDEAFAAKVDAAVAHLDPGLRIGSWGQLQEWKADWDDAHDEHRHVSHLYALHPLHQISPLTTPAFADAARITLRARGDGGTGWSKAWKINFWARLRDGDHAHKMLAEQLRQSTLPNLWDTHPPFQIDGNFGATAGVAEMLLQSQNGEIDLLPALPSAWTAGRVRGLRARGNVTVDMRWSNGALDEATLNVGKAGPLILRTPLLRAPFRLVNSAGGAVAITVNGSVGTFSAVPGWYMLQRI